MKELQPLSPQESQILHELNYKQMIRQRLTPEECEQWGALEWRNIQLRREAQDKRGIKDWLYAPATVSLVVFVVGPLFVIWVSLRALSLTTGRAARWLERQMTGR